MLIYVNHEQGSAAPRGSAQPGDGCSWTGLGHGLALTGPTWLQCCCSLPPFPPPQALSAGLRTHGHGSVVLLGGLEKLLLTPPAPNPPDASHPHPQNIPYLQVSQ